MSTNKAFAKYQEIYDVNTVSNKVSLIGIHTPVGAKPRKMLSGFFTQFRKYKYMGCSVVGTPAQRLGLNLAQLSTAAGQSAVNPKDVFNPALVRGCHGDNLSAALNSIYKGSFQNEGSSLGMDQFTDSVVPVDVTWESMYYRMLQDPSFKKFSLSSGIKLKGLHPMIYNVATDHQILPNETSDAVGLFGGIPDPAKTDVQFTEAMSEYTVGAVADGAGGKKFLHARLMTNRLQSLGWMDTRVLFNSDGTTVQPGYTVLPKIFMACIVLPPALSESVVTSMRFVVTHYFAFKEFNTSLTLEGASEYYDWLTAVSKSGKDNDTFETLSKSDSVELVNDACY